MSSATLSECITLSNYIAGAFYLYLDSDTGKFIRKFKFITPKKIRGWYTKYETNYVLVYRQENDLFVSFGSKKFKLENNVSTRWEFYEGVCHFEFLVDDKCVYKSDYTSLAQKGLNKVDLNYEDSIDDLLFAIHCIVAKPDSWSDCFNG